MVLKRCVFLYFWRTFPKLGIGIFLAFIVSNCLFLYCLLGNHSKITDVDDMKLSSRFFPESYAHTLEKYFFHDGWEWRIKHSASFNKSSSTDFNCSSLENLGEIYYLGSGWTKSSYRIVIDGDMLVLKTVNNEGHYFSKCVGEDQKKWLLCFKMSYMHAGTKILNEIVRLNILRHPNIIEVKGYCVPNKPSLNDKKSMISIITEFGESVDVIKLLTMSWEERLRVSLGLSRLLQFLSESPLGTVALNDFRRQQFVLVNGEIKLIDVDDIGLEDPTCKLEPCCIPSTVKTPVNVCVPCTNGYCREYNEKLNILNAGRHFISYILPHGAPTKFASMIERTVKAFKDASWSTSKIFQEMEHLTNLYIKGVYRNISSFSYLSGFRVMPYCDLPALYDYRCKLTVSGYGCSLSMFDEEEAATICAADSDCKAFVYTDVLTWTGRKMVHFKNGAQNYIKNNATTLYIKI